MKSNIILLTIVCIAPLLNVIFDYFLLHQEPSFRSCLITFLTLLILMFYIIFYKKNYKN